MAAETDSADASPNAASDDARERVKRGLVYALAMTPILGMQFPLGSGDPVSTGGVLVAVPLGAVLGVAAFAVANGTEFEPDSELRNLAVLLVVVAMAMVLSWLLIPADELGAFLVGTLAFIWAGALANTTRHVLLPRVSARTR